MESIKSNTVTTTSFEQRLAAGGLPEDHRFGDAMTADQFIALGCEVSSDPRVRGVLRAWPGDPLPLACWLAVQWGIAAGARSHAPG